MLSDEHTQALHGRTYDLLGWSEGKSHVISKARVTTSAALAWVDVEEFPGHRDYLVLQGGPEEAQSIAKRRRQFGHRTPQVKGAVGDCVELHSKLPQASEHRVALGCEDGLNSLGFTLYAIHAYQRQCCSL
jgi:hypothetical protein